MVEENPRNDSVLEPPEGENSKGKSPVFPLPDIIMLLIINGGVDLLEVMVGLTAVVPVVGWSLLLLEPGVDLLCLGITRFWFFARRAKSGLVMGGQLFELMPLADILPVRTITLILAMIIANHSSIRNSTEMGKSFLQKK
jgi:hypothetical protein